MIINTGNLQILNQGFNASFMQGWDSVAPTWQQVAMEIPSTTDAENYGWLEQIPGMREWIGQRQIHNLKSTGVSVKNRDWEHTLGVDVNAIEDDKFGTFALAFKMQGEVVRSHPDGLVWGLLPGGFTDTGLDGQYFFDSDHVGYNAAKAEVAYSNVQAGGGSPWFLLDLSRSFMKPVALQMRKQPQYVQLNQPNDQMVFMEKKVLYGADARYAAFYAFHQLAFGSKATLDVTNYEAARTAMGSQYKPDGTKLPVRSTHLVVGQSNEGAARRVLAERLANGADNVWAKSVELIVSPWLP